MWGRVLEGNLGSLTPDFGCCGTGGGSGTEATAPHPWESPCHEGLTWPHSGPLCRKTGTSWSVRTMGFRTGSGGQQLAAPGGGSIGIGMARIGHSCAPASLAEVRPRSQLHSWTKEFNLALSMGKARPREGQHSLESHSPQTKQRLQTLLLRVPLCLVSIRKQPLGLQSWPAGRESVAERLTLNF